MSKYEEKITDHGPAVGIASGVAGVVVQGLVVHPYVKIRRKNNR